MQIEWPTACLPPPLGYLQASQIRFIKYWVQNSPSLLFCNPHQSQPTQHRPVAQSRNQTHILHSQSLSNSFLTYNYQAWLVFFFYLNPFHSILTAFRWSFPAWMLSFQKIFSPSSQSWENPVFISPLTCLRVGSILSLLTGDVSVTG